MAAATTAVKNLLRYPDHVRAVLEVVQITTTASDDDNPTASSRRRCVLAVVSHKDDWNPTEEGCLFVYRRRAVKTRVPSIPITRDLAIERHEDDSEDREEEEVNEREALDIQTVFPIYGEFDIMISQTRRRRTVDYSMPPQRSSGGGGVSMASHHSDAVITLSITPAQGSILGQPHDSNLTFGTTDVDGLKSLIAECRRLKDVTDFDAHVVVNLAKSTTNFSWLKHYFTKTSVIAALMQCVPQDLRQDFEPIHQRLSPAYAGYVEDELSDIQIIRDDWIRRTSRLQSRRHRKAGGGRLCIRLGTFNVNGKMPSQDLSAWVQACFDVRSSEQQQGSLGSVEDELPPPSTSTPLPSLSPLQRVSPFSIPKNPLVWVSRKGNATTTSPQPVKSVEMKEEETELPHKRIDDEDPDSPDLFVFGFQELDLSTEALLYSTSTTREDAWVYAIFAALGEKGVKYEKLDSKQLVGMLIVILVKKSLKKYFGVVGKTAVGAGILGVMGNKGGTAIRLTFTPESSSSSSSIIPLSLTFVNSHLAAFDEMVEKRNADFHELSRRLLFEGVAVTSSAVSMADERRSHDDGDSTDSSYYHDDFLRSPSSSSMVNLSLGDESGGGDELGLKVSTPLSVFETDVLFWMGDLNYRMDIPDLDIRRILSDEGWDNDSKFEALLRFDQLKKAIKSRSAFFGFEEGKIMHTPTYRFSPGIAVDDLGYDKKRRPAWTDRILYMHGRTARVEQIAYTSCPQISFSDHRPVVSDFYVDYDYCDAEEYKAQIRRRFNEVSHLDMEPGHDRRGGLKIDEMFIDFGKVFFGASLERKVVIRNTGKSPCAFRFVPIHPDAPIYPNWLRVRPLTGVLIAGQTIEVSLRAEVDEATAALLNVRPKDLSSTLILHTMLGKDHFISVSGEFQYTCFANTLERLIRLPGPARTLKSPNDLLSESQSRNAPKELIRLINWMMSNPASTNDIFVCRGEESTIATIRECLDTGDEFPFLPETSGVPIRLAFGDTLLRFLNSLPDAVVPATLHPRCVAATDRDEAFEVLDGLPPASVNVWVSVTAFIHYICQDLNEEEQRNLAFVVAPVLLRDDPDFPLHVDVSPMGKFKFLSFFIV